MSALSISLLNHEEDWISGIYKIRWRDKAGGLMIEDSLSQLAPGVNFYCSFSTSFIFAIVPKYQDLFGHGIAFVLAQSANLSYALPSQFLGLFNSSNSYSGNQIVAIELDTNMNPEFNDIDNNHVGIDVNGPKSIRSKHAAYFTNDNGGGFQNLSLVSGKPIQAWIEYDHLDGQLNVTLAPTDVAKPAVPCLSSNVNLSSWISDYMHVGFSSAVGPFITSHYVLGWSFKLNGKAQALDLSRLPSLPRVGSKSTLESWKIGLLIILAIVLLLIIITGTIFFVKRRIKFREVFEEWETPEVLLQGPVLGHQGIQRPTSLGSWRFWQGLQRCDARH